MAKFLDYNGLMHFWRNVSNTINQRINDAVTNGLHQCHSCGAPYSGKAICEYCGRGFFVDVSMYKAGDNNE